LAQRLAALNRERRKIEATMTDEAFASVEDSLNQTTVLPCGMCLYEPQWHQGVIGIIASRVKERCHRPVFAFAAANAQELKGSGRSIEGVHLRDVLSAIAATHPGLLHKFGGHAMAAGLSLEKDKFPAFQSAFEQEVAKWIEPAGLQNVILSDGAVQADEMDINMAQLIEQAGPWGQGFPEPVFDGVFEIRNRRLLKDAHLKLALRMPGVAANLDAIAFNFHQGQAEPRIPPEGEQVRLAFRMEINEFRQQRQLQLNVLAIAD
jgi:single-stranded-DNA-specific exonuclease